MKKLLLVLGISLCYFSDGAAMRRALGMLRQATRSIIPVGSRGMATSPKKWNGRNIRKLLARRYPDLETCDKQGDLPIHWALKKCSDHDLTAEIVAMTEDLSLCDGDGNTPHDLIDANVQKAQQQLISSATILAHIKKRDDLQRAKKLYDEATQEEPVYSHDPKLSAAIQSEDDHDFELIQQLIAYGIAEAEAVWRDPQQDPESVAYAKAVYQLLKDAQAPLFDA